MGVDFAAEGLLDGLDGDERAARLELLERRATRAATSRARRASRSPRSRRCAASEGDEFPPLRVGVAHGPAVARAGDWYGRPVNLAGRITAIARPGSVLATREIRDAAPDGYRWWPAGRRALRGIDGQVALYRARRAGG